MTDERALVANLLGRLTGCDAMPSLAAYRALAVDVINALDAARSLGQREPEPPQGAWTYAGDGLRKCPRCGWGVFAHVCPGQAGQREPVGEALDYDAMRMAREWPTPNHMRSAADALDILTIPKYGDVLRWFADRCDEWVWHMGDPAAKDRLEQARAALRAAANPEREDTDD